MNDEDRYGLANAEIGDLIDRQLAAGTLSTCDVCGRFYVVGAEGWDGVAEAPDGTLVQTGGRMCGKCMEKNADEN